MDKVKKNNMVLTIIIIAVIIVIATILSVFILVFQKNNTKTSLKDLSADYIASNIVKKMNYQNLSEISSDNISKYYDIPNNVVSDSDMYVSSHSDACTEIACFKLVDQSKEETLKKSISDYINSKLNTYKGVNDKEYQAVSNSKTKIEYPYVMVVISEDPDTAVSAFEEIIK